MANKYTQYGAVVAGATAIPAVFKGVGAATDAFKASNALTAGTDVSGAMGAAADAGTSAMSSAFSSTLNNPAFLTSVGVGLVGLALGSGSKIPSLNLPNLAATAAVGLSVSALLKQGKAAAASAEQASMARGGSLTSPSNFKTSAAMDPNIAVMNEREKGKTLQLTFPKSLSPDYWMRFSVRKYDRKSSQSNASSTLSDFHTMIKLPLPNNLVDAIKISYQELGMGMFGGPMLDIADDAYKAFQSNGGSMGSKFGSAAQAGVGGMAKLLSDDNVKAALARKLITNSTMGAAFDMITGNAPNPHMAISFNGVNLKKHSYTWRFSPDNYAESKELENIIRNLQAAALPGIEGEYALLLKFPDIVIVEMNPSNLIPFKPCVIDSVGINYAPNGVPSFFRAYDTSADDGKRYPTEVEMTIILREMDIHTSAMPFYSETRQGQNDYYEGEAPSSAVQTSEATQLSDLKPTTA
jgi:hypothetical protein